MHMPSESPSGSAAENNAILLSFAVMTTCYSPGSRYRQFNLMECASYRITYPPQRDCPDKLQQIPRSGEMSPPGIKGRRDCDSTLRIPGKLNR
jgi:hypothetical protein